MIELLGKYSNSVAKPTYFEVPPQDFITGSALATARWASLSYDDLGIGDANATGMGVTSHIRETYNSTQYYTRGNKNNYAFGPSNQNMDNAFNSTGWRPFLELVSGDQPWV